MALELGIHAGPQDLSIDELQRLWRRADEAGFHWVSVWDHFYANPLVSRANPCFEGVASMAALAATTERVRVGCLVFCALFRNPGLLAKAAVTVDHLSGGRAEIGLGAGWFQEEFRDFGYGFPPLGRRMDQLEEALQVVRSLLREPETHFKGEFYELDGAVCSPRPLNPNLPLWVGGYGQRRTPRLAARYADGYNLPYLPPEGVADRLERLARERDAAGRGPAELDTSVNVGFYMSASAADAEKRGPMPEGFAAGSLTGTVQEVCDRIGAYEATGIRGLNLAFRPPIDWDALDAFIADVLPRFS